MKEWQKCCVYALFLKHFYTGRAAKVHGKLTALVHPNYIIVIQLKIVPAKPGILDELLHTFKSHRPDRTVQTFLLRIIRVTVGNAPLASGYRSQLGYRQSLQCLHTGIIINIVCRKPTDTHIFKCPAGRDEEDMALLRRIQQLLHQKGMTIEGARRILDGSATLDEVLPERAASKRDPALMLKLKNELTELRRVLAGR